MDYITPTRSTIVGLAVAGLLTVAGCGPFSVTSRCVRSTASFGRLSQVELLREA